MSSLIVTGPADATARLLLAHGAGAPMTSPWLELLAGALAAHAIEVVRFEFAYMARRRSGGTRRPPPRAETLCPEFEQAVAGLAAGPPLFIGGKSMGGRVASLVADRLFAAGACRGLVSLGYPFHPPKQADRLRTAHLATLACPTLIVQGTRDPLGSRDEVERYPLSPAVRVHWIDGGDHELKAARRPLADSLAVAAAEVARFLAAHSAG